MHRRTLLGAALVAPALTPLAAPALRAQTFDKPIRIIVPNAPGGTSDIIARLITVELSKAVGQNVVVENRAGAAGNIGADVVAKSAPDGHTLLLMDVSTLAINPTLFPRMPFDVEKDLTPVSMVIYAPYLLAVKNALPAKNAAELAAYSKSKGLNIANSGVGSLTHLTSVEVGNFLGGEVTHVPYRGGAPALNSLVTGEADMLINGATATQPFVVNGQMRGIAVSGPKRLAALPDVPTFTEAGLPMADAGTWQGIMVQGNTPRPMVERLLKELKSVVEQPAITARLRELGGETWLQGPDSFKTWLVKSTAEFGAIVTKNGIKPE